MAFAREIDMCHAVGVFQFVISGEAIEDQRESLVALHVAGTLEVFIQHCADQVLRRRDEARRTRLIGELPADQTIVICEIEIHLHI